MAEQQGVWGIEIGQAGLKAIRLRYADAASQALAVAFDYIPHPKILSQPDAIPEELIPQALDKFLQRNQVRGDLLAISVPGNISLIKFIKLPPVESSKIAEIVKYEARQQIPFALEDVIWDFQSLGGGADADTGFVLDAEVGLFAMKREQVQQHLRPFTSRKLEIELIQSAPLSVFNMLAYDQMGIRVDGESTAADEYFIVIDMGADNTSMLVTNGRKIWNRNIPIGGNHFTRALSKEMKLTFAKAEHLKCNATKSPDPRAVFQALRPVFNEFVAEIQRSIGFFSSVNRDAKITKVIGVGNGFKMAGLQKFLEQNLQYEVTKLERFKGLVGDSVLSDPLFEENILTFAVPYGLALQALKLSILKTSLLPPEIATARIIRRKKPWAMAAAATLLFGFAVSAAGYANVQSSYDEQYFGAAEKDAKTVADEKNRLQGEYTGQVGQLDGIRKKELQLIEPTITREYWPEVYRAINACLPRDVGDARATENIQHQQRIKILAVSTEKNADLAKWFSGLSEQQKVHMDKAHQEKGPEGAGYVFTLHGVTYYTDPTHAPDNYGVYFIVNTLLRNLESLEVTPPEESPVPVGLIGISHPALLQTTPSRRVYDPEGFKQRTARENIGSATTQPGTSSYLEDGPTTIGPMPPSFRPPTGFNRPPMSTTPNLANLQSTESTQQHIEQVEFVLQFVWKPTPREERAKLLEAAAAAKQAESNADANPESTETP